MALGYYLKEKMVGVGEQQRNYDAVRRPHSDTGRGHIPLLRGLQFTRGVREMDVQTSHLKIQWLWLEGLLVRTISLEGNLLASHPIIKCTYLFIQQFYVEGLYHRNTHQIVQRHKGKVFTATFFL